MFLQLAMCTAIIVHIANCTILLYKVTKLYNNIVQFAMCTKITVRFAKCTIPDFVCYI